MQDKYSETVEKENVDGQEETEYVYKNVIKKDKSNRRTWSVVSLIFAVLSIAFVYFSWVGLIFGLIAAGCAAMSRVNLGYFDKLSLAGILVGIFGIVFSIAGMIFGQLISGFFM